MMIIIMNYDLFMINLEINFYVNSSNNLIHKVNQLLLQLCAGV